MGQSIKVLGACEQCHSYIGPSNVVKNHPKRYVFLEMTLVTNGSIYCSMWFEGSWWGKLEFFLNELVLYGVSTEIR